jgi:Flp pilus assembly protein TadG
MNAPHDTRQRGATTLMILILVTSILLMAGLTYDGGQILAARREAIDVAQSAARAGAQQLDPAALRAGHTTLDNTAAVHTAEGFLRDNGYTGVATVNNGQVQVQVTVTITRHLAFLSAVGMHERTVHGVGTARPVRGVTGAES